MEKKEILKLILGNEYYTIDDLRYNQKLGFMFSKDELAQFLKDKESLVEQEDKFIQRLPLKTFNSKYCFFVNGKYLALTHSEYLSMVIEDFEVNQETIFNRNIEDMLMSRVFSEVEGTLNVENVPTTHKRIKEIYEKKNLIDKYDVFI